MNWNCSASSKPSAAAAPTSAPACPNPAVQMDAELQIIAHLVRNLNAYCLLRFARGSGDVRSENHVFQIKVRRFLWRFHGENIERRAGHLPALESGDQVRILNEFATRAVDDAYALFHFREGLGVDNAGGLGREAHVQREVVRSGNQLVERDQLDAGFARYGSRHKRIAAQNLKAKA